MSDVRRQDEPSMEEILASIRRIIAEDNAAAPAPAGDQDILELTDKVEADGTVVTLASRMPPRDTRPEPARAARDEAPIAVAPVEAKSDRERLMSEAASSASIAALAQLAKELPRKPAAALAPNGDAMLEDATRELLKPLLKTWLDAHLPAIIERLVREEIARIGTEAKSG